MWRTVTLVSLFWWIIGTLKNNYLGKRSLKILYLHRYVDDINMVKPATQCFTHFLRLQFTTKLEKEDDKSFLNIILFKGTINQLSSKSKSSATVTTHLVRSLIHYFKWREIAIKQSERGIITVLARNMKYRKTMRNVYKNTSRDDILSNFPYVRKSARS